MRDTRAFGQSADEPSLAGKADGVEAIKKAIDDAAAVSGGLWLSYLFVLFYIAIAAGAVTHADLLLQRAVKLPFLDVELPLLAFFALAPFLFLVTHAYTLAHFVMLGKKASRFDEQLRRELPDPECGAGQRDPLLGSVRKEIRDKQRQLLPSNIFVQMLAGPPKSRGGVLGFILKAITLTTLVLFPVSLLLLLQIQFLPYHYGWITWAQRIALILDIALLWALRPPILAPPSDGGAARARRRAVRAAGFVFAAVLSLIALWLSIVVATIPGEWQEKALARMDPQWWPDIWSEDKKAAKRISMRDFLFARPVSWTTQRRVSPFSNTLVLPGFSLYEGMKIDDP